ncbi:hypothetical protein EXN23_07665 [Agrobacterium salinitolerans]|uniref:Uncharacterized protein n=1 Tax=Agrobacterium salinitolerans TaxID=1183413 RepID=A0ABY3BT00_9HYPH|nr:hypothetical protein EXN23_07665 [Agrobacterium salinitolerans]
MKQKCGPKGRIFYAGTSSRRFCRRQIFEVAQIGGLTMKRQLATTKPIIEISRKPFNPSRIPTLLLSSEKRTGKVYRGSITKE